MTSAKVINYNRIAKAIAYIRENFREQPGLEEVAEEVNLSAYHFHRLFTEWAGVSPKKFLQYISLSYAKRMLKEEQVTLSEAAFETGLSGTGRLHDLFVGIEGMTPGVFKKGGRHLIINYSFSAIPFGKVLVASTEKGVCYLAFVDNEQQAFTDLYRSFPNADFHEQTDRFQQNALQVFSGERKPSVQVQLHLKGTPFQLKVWEALLKVPAGRLSTYGQLAEQLENPKASRAVGSAIGQNPVAFLIPCHRVIRANGEIGEYKWGSTRKAAIIGWEACNCREVDENRGD